ncbi:HNH endonuclease [Brachybacterium muris]|uniref:HNH endonuclease signature motif containing protein n=1 Tax=Brachybacterium muris TaxID=219301 RepID=UPI00223A978D|nr:HNH endonuclease signature motif containing protein [Brachybacterium muris]MCT2297095.1 HNH endonuclease [Brachybacterium muris]
MTLTTDPPDTNSRSADVDRPARPERLARADAEALGDRIQQQAALIGEATCQFLLMLAEFDQREGTGWYVGLKSTAHWLSWACSMSPGTAREHVRVARALPGMPLTVAAFSEGRLSYSKVREMTRVADRVDEATLVDLASAMTASQLARTLSSFRAVDGARLGQDAIRQARWVTREDGMIEIRAILPPEMGAELLTALDLALTRDGHDAPRDTDDVDEADAQDLAARAAEATVTPTVEQRKADALVHVARGYLEQAPTDRCGEDRHLVIVQVSADALTRSVPAGTPPHPTTSPPLCHVVGHDAPLEPATAERLACTGKIALQITSDTGEILHLGRSRRLASPAQRRALRLRDRTCSFPGCHQSRHLDAHHVTPWSEGGTTDIDGLALLCRRHHVIVHEGGHHLVPMKDQPAAPHLPRYTVIDQHGRPVTARWPAMLEHITHTPTTPDMPEPTGHPDRITGTTGGYGFRLADCVDTLLNATLTTAA